jgi:hypothetical protein
MIFRALGHGGSESCRGRHFCILKIFNFFRLNFVLQATEAPSTVEGDISPEEARCVCCVEEGGREGESERGGGKREEEA